jgi:hypothetical protein
VLSVPVADVQKMIATHREARSRQDGEEQGAHGEGAAGKAGRPRKMAAATWDSAYCLAATSTAHRSDRHGLHHVHDEVPDAVEAQNQVVADIAAICPHVLYPTVATASLPQLTISAAGDIGTFGTDANLYAKFPMGHGNIFQSLNDIPTNPFLDYMNEGTQIRALNNTTLPATLYWYGISQPADINATDQPAIKPEPARELIALRAAYNFGTEGNRNVALSQTMAAQYGYPLHDSKPGRFAFWMLTFKTQYANGGALDLTGRSLAIAGPERIGLELTVGHLNFTHS